MGVNCFLFAAFFVLAVPPQLGEAGLGHLSMVLRLLNMYDNVHKKYGDFFFMFTIVILDSNKRYLATSLVKKYIFKAVFECPRPPVTNS